MFVKESALFTYKSPWTYPCIPPSWVEAISIDSNTIKRGRPEIRQKWRSIVYSKTGWKIASSLFWRKVLMSWQFLYNSKRKRCTEKISINTHSFLTVPYHVSQIVFGRGTWQNFPFLSVWWDNKPQRTADISRRHPTGFHAKWRLSKERRNSILMTCHYQDLGSASDWIK